MWFPISLPWETCGFLAVSLMLTLGNMRFLVVFFKFPFVTLRYPYSIQSVSIWETQCKVSASFYPREPRKVESRSFPFCWNYNDSSIFSSRNHREPCWEPGVSKVFTYCFLTRGNFFFQPMKVLFFRGLGIVSWEICNSLTFFGDLITLLHFLYDTWMCKGNPRNLHHEWPSMNNDVWAVIHPCQKLTMNSRNDRRFIVAFWLRKEYFFKKEHI